MEAESPGLECLLENPGLCPAEKLLIRECRIFPSSDYQFSLKINGMVSARILVLA